MTTDVPWYRRLSLREVVTVLATLCVLVVLIAVSMLLLSRQRDELLEHLDETLYAEAGRMAMVLESGGRVSSGDDRMLVVVDASGTPLEASVNGQPYEPAELVAAIEAAGSGDVTAAGEDWRMVSYRFPTESGLGIVHLGGEFEDVDEGVTALRRTLAWLVPVATVGLGLLIWTVVGRTLRPVERIRAEVAAIGPGELDRRVKVPASDDEISRLAETMNAMLDRLQESAQRQQRFVADASHELRTPLTRMRAELEADERDPAHADPAATRVSQLEEIETLQRLIEDLLLLAHGDAGLRAGHAAVDLDDLVHDELRRARAEEATVVIDASRVSAAQVAGNADRLRRVVRNLLANACRHADSTVEVELTERAGAATLVISDDGPGIAPADAERIFERFSRIDDARTNGDGGAGLGLAIVRDIVVAHGGHVNVDATDDGGARFTVSIPVATTAPAGDGVR